MIRCVLFDIDGTLLDARGAGRRAFVRALREELGHDVEDLRLEVFAGRTDRAIFRALLERAGFHSASEEQWKKVTSLYLRHLAEEFDRSTEGGLYPGVIELLMRLGRDPEFVVGILTGNLEAAAVMKLRHYGIDSFFRFGAFGDEEEDRSALLPIAMSRAEKHAKRTIPRSSIALVGDTPRDIECARAGGVSILTVATGLFDRSTLQEWHPDILREDLAATDRIYFDLRHLTDPPSEGKPTPDRAD